MRADPATLSRSIKAMGKELGFQQIGIASIELAEDAAYLRQWLDRGRHGTMRYMEKHGEKRWRPDALVPGTVRVISASMDYFPGSAKPIQDVLDDSSRAFVSRYALGRDYHKVIRRRLQRLCDEIETLAGEFGYRVFVDSAPVLEKALARNGGLGWIGKHTNLLNTQAGSWFFIGEIYTDLPLQTDGPVTDHCGTCSACIEVCPTRAIVAPYQLDARRCISYLTIEHRGTIPEPLRAPMGNRIYGCDDCQLVCPWNKFAQPTSEPDFAPRHGLDDSALVSLFAWTEADFDKRMEGSAIRRIGYLCWLRNIAVALGNAPSSDEVIHSLQARQHHPSTLVREHVQWALAQHLSAN